MLTYDVVDVFTDRPFAGNQLAVVHGAEELSTAQCLAIAQEFGFSETTFPVATGGSSYSTRIFTPAAEIPFAGHPTLGTAWVLRRRVLLEGEHVVQHCGAGEIDVRFDGEDTVELSATPRDLVGPLGDDLVTALLADVGLSIADLAGPVWAAGCGLTFVHLPVLAGAVERADASSRPLGEYARHFAAVGPARDPIEGINLHHVSGEAPDLDVHARVFVPGLSVAEDPATGSAAAGLGMALVASGRLPEGGSYRIRQGVEMGRPSQLQGRVEATSGAAHRCHVAGSVQQVASGEIAVPPA
ncbi:MAG: PhzF family phenazine biosynthesis protein [Nocardioidaceae bacterium]